MCCIFSSDEQTNPQPEQGQMDTDNSEHGNLEVAY